MGVKIDCQFEGLTEDFAAIKTKFDFAMQTTMQAMLAETETALHDRIVSDVYEAFGNPEPKDYIRRKEDYGLIDFNESHGIVSRDTDKNSFTIGYYPQGWSSQADPDWILDGDELIERIETAYPSYDWSGDVPGPRPFLTPLMNDLIEGGKYEEWFVKWMNTSDADLELISDGDVQRDADDWG